MSKEPKRNVYVGHRYVPKIFGEWDKNQTYEGLSIVTNEGTSYTSKKYVPVGVDIGNEEYWAVTGNYNAQIEAYRKEVKNMQDSVDKVGTDLVGATETINAVEKVSAKNTIDFESRSINALTPPPPFEGIKLNDASVDNAPIINKLLENFNSVYLPVLQNIYIQTTITVPDNKSLTSDTGMAKIHLLTPNIPGVEVKNHSKVDNIKVFLPRGNTSDLGCGFRLRTSQISSRQFIGRIEVIGLDETGNGIYAGGETNTIAFSVIDSFYGERLKTGFKADFTPPAYANSLIFNNFVMRSSIQGIWLSGSDANIFNNIEWNNGYRSDGVIYCNSSSNQFNGFFYDVYKSDLYSDLLATFAENGFNNTIRSSNYEDQWRIVDHSRTKMNYINGNKNSIMKVINEASQMPNAWLNLEERRQWGEWFFYKPYGGIQDNFLSFADELQNVTSKGKQHYSGSLSTIFNPFIGLSVEKPTWNLIGSEEISIEIELLNPSFTTKRIDFLQVVFSSGFIAKDVKMEVFRDNQWSVVSEVTDNKKRYVTHRDTVNAIPMATADKLRFTIKAPVSSTGDVRIEAINGRMLASGGNTFLPKNGGKIVGDLEFNKPSTGVILKSPNNTKYKLQVDDNGVLTTRIIND